jgi:hypothetical protein
MTKEEIAQIKVGQHRTGIIGLKNALKEISREFADKPDDIITAELFKRLSKLNYIPENSQKNYENAFLREYKKLVGQSHQRSSLQDLEIKVLGGGCPCCDDVEQDLMAVMTEMNLAADIEHVSDPAEIKIYNVSGTPALVINGEVKAVGAMPRKPQIKALLSEITSKNQQAKS